MPKAKEPLPLNDQPAFTSKEVELLEAYLELCFDKGVINVTLQDVAAKAKVAFGTVHYYFGGKERSLSESAVTYVGEISRDFTAKYLDENSISGKYSGIEAYIQATFRFFGLNRRYGSIWVYFYYLSSINSSFRGKNGQFLLEARKRTEKLLYEAMGRKAVKELKDVESLAVKIHTALAGAIFVALCDPGRSAIENQCQIAIQSANDLIRAHQLSRAGRERE